MRLCRPLPKPLGHAAKPTTVPQHSDDSLEPTRIHIAPGGNTPTMTEHEAQRATKAKGKLKEALGNVTGDRRVEAVGRVEATKGHEPDDREEREAEQEVRRDHGDIA